MQGKTGPHPAGCASTAVRHRESAAFFLDMAATAPAEQSVQCVKASLIFSASSTTRSSEMTVTLVVRDIGKFSAQQASRSSPGTRAAQRAWLMLSATAASLFE